ncbi:MAG: flavin reductase family protein [Planctomycetota bacterium]
MPEFGVEDVVGALALPGGLVLMTAHHDGDRAGLMARSAMLCAEEPVLVAVAIRRGHPIAPLIRDSHTFALNLLHAPAPLLERKFGARIDTAAPDEAGDPFDAIPHRSLGTGAPVLDQCVSALDCEVVRHFDLEADHELYIGQVVGFRGPAKP